MIDPQLVNAVDRIRRTFLEAMKQLGQTKSFTSLVDSSDKLRAELGELQRIAAVPRLHQPCTPTFVCAVVGSSGDGKTSIMAELFPDLAQRGWLITESTDTTAQALIVSHAPAGSAELEEAVVYSWDIDQITRLVKAADKENADARIISRYLPDVVEVDGSEAVFAAADRNSFKFDVCQQLRPLPHAYRLSPQERTDPALMRSLTVKELSYLVKPDPVLSIDGQAFHTLHLRAAVKAISLRDSFQQLAGLAKRPAEDIAGLVFVDTPGLRGEGSMKDEVLRNVLGKKNQQIVVELLRNDDLDLIVHLVLCRNQSSFSSLWRAVREQCEPDELTDLGERLVLAITGTNQYFFKDDMKRIWSDPAAPERERDHFAQTLEDNVLKKMSESGTVTPARICFIDSRQVVEKEQGPYQEFYERHRPVMQAWTRPGGVGYRTLERLGLLESFTRNIDALCDPSDRGQGFLVRQILELAREKGPRLFLRKNFRRNHLHGSLKKLREMLLRYYDAQGKLNRQAIQDAVRACLHFLNPRDPQAIEVFARQKVDPQIEALVPGPDSKVDSQRWVSDVFNEVSKRLHAIIKAQAPVAREIQALFDRYFQDRLNVWKTQWGYRAAALPIPSPQHPNTGDLLKHALKLHVREILYQLLTGDKAADSAKNILQDAQDQEQVCRLLTQLEQAVKQANNLCQQHGVSTE